MRTKNVKRIFTMVMACVILSVMSVTVSAAQLDFDESNYEATVVPRANTAIKSGSTATLSLGHVEGYANVTLTIVTASSGNGIVNWELHSSEQITAVRSSSLGVNNMTSIPMLLSKGDYTITITNKGNKETTVFAFFENN